MISNQEASQTADPTADRYENERDDRTEDDKAEESCATALPAGIARRFVDRRGQQGQEGRQTAKHAENKAYSDALLQPHEWNLLIADPFQRL
jgi:hypothetical protein